jgi:Mg/Co/Ni transporter MgtE
VAGKEDWLAHWLPFEGDGSSVPRAGDRMRRDAPTCGPDDRIGAVRERVRAAGWDSCVVVNEQRVVLGLLRGRHLSGAPETSAESAMMPGPSTSRPHTPLDELQEYFEEHDVSTTTITTSDGVLLGVLRRADVCLSSQPGSVD